jgi:hypothetical protein
MRIALLLISLGMLASGAAATQSALTITRSAYLETRTPSGASLEPVSRFKSGDKVVLVMQWSDQAQTEASAARPFTLTSKVPPVLAFQKSSRTPLSVSVDGAKSWGRLGELRIGQRLAAPEDVTNIRWQIAAQDRIGTLSYSAIVR